MQVMIDAVAQVYKNWCGDEPEHVDVLPQSGSDRRYFRLHSKSCPSVIATLGSNVPENEAFIYFSNHFKNKGLHVPEVLAVNKDKTIYLQIKVIVNGFLQFFIAGNTGIASITDGKKKQAGQPLFHSKL
jgi:aminoglycoside/choline kinase family phosphotransferase